MKAIEAVKKLSSLGYRFELAGDRLRYLYEGPGEPDPDMVRPLLATVKNYKPVVLAYMTRQAMPERVLTCFECQYFRQAVGENPRQAWGRCLKRNKGRFGCAAACEKTFELKKF